MKTLLMMVMLVVSPLMLEAKEIYAIDFSQQQDGDAMKWLKSNGFEFMLDANNLSLKFESGRLKIETAEEIAGIIGLKFSKEEYLDNVESVVIEWGVEQFPKDADWKNGNNRVAIGLFFVLGTEKLSSGLPFGINAAPYFLAPFIGENEEVDKLYFGALYNKGGRYYCVANKSSEGQVVTRFNIKNTFRKEFDKPVPPLTAVAFQVNTQDTQGSSSAFIKKITFLSK